MLTVECGVQPLPRKLSGLLYTHKDFQGQGVGTKLLDTIVAQAAQLQLSRLFVEVSITARSFFEHRGFVIVKPQQVECRGVKLSNFVMEYYL